MKSLLPSSRRHDISIHHSGRIDISARVARILSLRPGDVIDITAGTNGELYLYVRQRAAAIIGRHAGTVWATAPHGKGTYRCKSQQLARAVLSHARCTAVRLRCPCGEPIQQDNTTYVTIIHHCQL